MENHPRYLEVVWGCHYAGLDLHRLLVAADRAASWPTSSTTAGPRSSSRRRTRPTRPPRSSPTRPDVELRLMLDGVDRRLRALRGRRRRAARRAARPTASPGTDMLYSSGTTGRPKGVTPPFADEPLEDDADRRRRAAGSCCSASTTDSVYLSPAPLLPRRAAAVLPWPSHALGGTVVVMEHFDPEQYLRAHRALPASRTARSCRRCSCAC